MFFATVTDSAREINELDFVLAVFQTEIQEARNNSMSNIAILLELCLAKLYYLYIGEQNKAVRIWNRVLETFTGSRGESKIAFAKLKAIEALSRHILRLALNAKIDSPNANEHAQTLEIDW